MSGNSFDGNVLASNGEMKKKKLKRFRNEGEGDETDKKEAAKEDEA